MKNRLFAITGVITGLLSAATLAAGQKSPVTQPRDNIALLRSAEVSGDPLSEILITPEMVMTHARELKLTQDQRAFILKEVTNSSVEFNDLRWQLDTSVKVLREMIKAESVNEVRALTQLDKVLDTELKIKRLHMRMSIRIKNQLTADQLGKLQSIRSSRDNRER